MAKAKSKQVPVETKVLDTTLEGNPLLVTKFTEFRDGKLQEESLLANGRTLRLIAHASDLHPDTYSVEFLTPTNGRSFSISSPSWFVFTGLLNGGDASLSVDPDTLELVFKIR